MRLRFLPFAIWGMAAPPDVLAERDPVVEALARAIAPSPAIVDESVMESCLSMAPAAIVEVVTFVSLMQLLHRVETYYAA